HRGLASHRPVTRKGLLIEPQPRRESRDARLVQCSRINSDWSQSPSPRVMRAKLPLRWVVGPRVRAQPPAAWHWLESMLLGCPLVAESETSSIDEHDHSQADEKPPHRQREANRCVK